MNSLRLQSCSRNAPPSCNGHRPSPFAIAIFLLATLTTAPGCTGTKPDRTFRVAVPFLLDTFDPHHNNVNVIHYVNVHTYYPLFERDDLGKLQSQFLDLTSTRAENSSFTLFSLCLKSKLRFSDGTSVTSDDLTSSLQSTHEAQGNLWPATEIKASSPACTLVKLSHADPSYFDKLTTMQSTVLKKGTGIKEPIGLGPYRIMARTPERLTLEARPEIPQPDFRKIEFVVMKSPKDAGPETISDWNHNYQYDVPDFAKANSSSVHRRLLKTYGFILDFKNENTRKLVGSCLVKHKAADYLLKSLSSEAGTGFLPLGLSGAIEDFPLQEVFGNCEKPSPALTKTVNFYCIGDRQCVGMRKFFDEHRTKLPFKADLKEVNGKEYVDELLSTNENVMIMGNDSFDEEPSTFFTAFYGPDCVTLSQLTDLEALLKTAARSDNKIEKDRLFREAHVKVLRSGLILPIGQVVSDQYYPKNISNLRILNRTTGFPQINQFKVAK